MPAPGLRSMTGYAQARAERNGWAVELSVRSVNHRFLDVRVHLPEGWDAAEPEIRKILRDRVRRGHVDVTLHVRATKAGLVSVNHELAAAYLRAAKSLCERFGINSEPDVTAILRLPGVASAATLEEGKTEEFSLILRECLGNAIEQLDRMRYAEGAALERELLKCLERVEELTKQAETLVERTTSLRAKRLQVRISEMAESLSGASGGSLTIDPARIAQEAAFAAERGDVTEELARLRSHLEQFQKLVKSAGEAGKKMDFLLQEMQREANTLLSKISGMDSDDLAITQLGLELKSEIEKIREQTQNIE